MNLDAIVAALRADFAEAGDPARAAAMRAYMKERFPFFGIPAGARRKGQRAFWNRTAGGPPDRAALLPLVRRLWREPEREFQYAAMDWLDRRARHLTPDDLPVIEELISTRSWWDTVDILASHLAGGILRRHRDLASAKVGEWLDSGELWLQRTALLCQLKWKTDTDRDLLALAIDRTRDSPEFFLRKAIGWALREYAKTDPGWVRAYVDRTPNLSPLSRREALKHER